MEYTILNNGVQMPKLGFGVYKINDLSQCEQAVSDALDIGYRSIDTAKFYQNEEAVGRAIQKSAVPREDIFLTTKVWIDDHGDEKTEQAVYGSLRRLQTDYLDLVLIHQPFGDYYGAYRALEKLYREGIIRAIGVSNFYPGRFLDLAHHVDVIPAINQVENHVFYQQSELQETMKPYGTALEAWGPLAQGKHGFFTHPTLQEIGQKYGKSNSQVGLRYLLQRDRIVIPKSVHRDRIEENFEVFDFELSQKDMDNIKELDTNEPNALPNYDPRRVEYLLNK